MCGYGIHGRYNELLTHHAKTHKLWIWVTNTRDTRMLYMASVARWRGLRPHVSSMSSPTHLNQPTLRPPRNRDVSSLSKQIIRCCVDRYLYLLIATTAPRPPQCPNLQTPIPARPEYTPSTPISPSKEMEHNSERQSCCALQTSATSHERRRSVRGAIVHLGEP
jgi:hypothetical protein